MNIYNSEKMVRQEEVSIFSLSFGTLTFKLSFLIKIVANLERNYPGPMPSLNLMAIDSKYKTVTMVIETIQAWRIFAFFGPFDKFQTR